MTRLSERSAEEALREYDEERRQRANEIVLHDLQMQRSRPEEFARERYDLLSQFPHEQQAAISRLQALDWSTPRGEIGTVITTEGLLGYRFLQKTAQMALWPVGEGVYLGSDGNLWRDPEHAASVRHARFRPCDPKNFRNLRMVEIILEGIKTLAT